MTHCRYSRTIFSLSRPVTPPTLRSTVTMCISNDTVHARDTLHPRRATQPPRSPKPISDSYKRDLRSRDSRDHGKRKETSAERTFTNSEQCQRRAWNNDKPIAQVTNRSRTESSAPRGSITPSFASISTVPSRKARFCALNHKRRRWRPIWDRKYLKSPTVPLAP